MNVSLERINKDYLFQVSNSDGKSVLLITSLNLWGNPRNKSNGITFNGYCWM